mmetsp:Transcript_23648/g.36339  ORF Transcript_23648/g.36339 Transcript_23648/m.36339 type:complete len:110 (+) Transcript_23648:600-929(+)
MSIQDEVTSTKQVHIKDTIRHSIKTTRRSNYEDSSIISKKTKKAKKSSISKSEIVPDNTSSVSKVFKESQIVYVFEDNQYITASSAPEESTTIQLTTPSDRTIKETRVT